MSVLRRMVRLGLTVSNPDMLTMAAYYNHLGAVHCLVKELGEDLNKAPFDGCTALMAAEFHKRDIVVHSLLKVKADP